MAVLSIRDLVIDFETDDGMVQAIDQLSFEVGEGEIVGLVGESGCGKTTVARCVLGVLPRPPARLRQGEVQFRGQNLLRLSETDLTRHIRGKAITFIPQDPMASLNPLFPVGTQLQDMLAWGAWRGRSRSAIRQRLLELMQQVQLPSPEAMLRKYPHECSGGQRQRLVIAAALAPEPALIIADEPTSALDVTVQAQILLLLKTLVHEHGTSVLLITHDLGVVAKLCDRVVVMYAGQEAEMAPTAALFDNPSHPYTARLLESVPERQQGELRGIPGTVPNLVAPPQGCRFHTRCEFAMDACKAVQPAPVELSPEHWVRCHLFTGVEAYGSHS
ncbi:MAG: ABC transporter ATP-binding protein [Candidatus Tectimicrobiota bacterium]